MTLFLGNVPESADAWQRAVTKVGSVVHFGGNQFRQGVCANCQRHAENDGTRQIGGQVSLTKTLLNIIEAEEEIEGKRLYSLGTDEVSEFLKENLHWRVSSVSRKLQGDVS